MYLRRLVLLWCLCVVGWATPMYAGEMCPSGRLVVGTDATFPPFTSKVGDQFVGLEIELGEAVGQRLGCQIEWVNSSFDGIFPALLAGKYDMVIASTTITEERKKTMRFSDPYVDAAQVLVVKQGTLPGRKFSDLNSITGLKVGVGLNTTGQFLAEGLTSITLSKYPSIDLALTDLQNERLDVIIGDGPVMRYMIRENFGQLQVVGQALNAEQWGMVFAPEREALLLAVNGALRQIREDGTLKGLETKFLGNTGVEPAPSTPEVKTGGEVAPPAVMDAPGFKWDRFVTSIPLFIKGAGWTLSLSVLSFVVAVPLGLLIALMRMSRMAAFRGIAAGWIELLRGTPLLVQIFFIYFVLPAFGVSFADSTTAVLALSINASAYVAEVFRAGLQSIDPGQREAGLALGLTQSQVLRYILIPQAVRRVVPPLTNEAIALIKDSSLVSIMGMTELTRTGQELASRYADPLSIWPGVALTYFILTFPLTRLSARLEARLHAGERRLSEH